MHVRVCVDCGEEYRPEIAVCADCGGPLEDRYEGITGATGLPAEPEADPNEAFTETLLHRDHATDLVADADRLVEQGIACRVRPHPRRGFWLCVTADDLPAARTALSLSPEERDDQRSLDLPKLSQPCPACGTVVMAEAAECPDCGLVLSGAPEGDEET